MTTIGKWEIVDKGVKRKIHQPGKQLMMMEVEFEAGGIGVEHSHPHEQYTYCLSGKFEFKVAGETIVLTKGETLYIPGEAIHSCLALEDGSLLDTFTPLREDLLDFS
ncbi:cupin domain-containing protein [Halalkalibacter krulwichiae]|uniref:Cupin domain protein n=1 Tax=Halalkalibacter krulwichiae TaxID=199441 RepID=A0A1X9MGH6_9BACI|nr:cupin domain-containing protein [Halalkalibacter krulwichiae]ARK29542.1 Cupin domain protein [Halalkalibacter krulwichiae]